MRFFKLQSEDHRSTGYSLACCSFSKPRPLAVSLSNRRLLPLLAFNKLRPNGVYSDLERTTKPSAFQRFPAFQQSQQLIVDGT